MCLRSGRENELQLSSPDFQEVTLGSYTLPSAAGSYTLFENVELFGRIENGLDDGNEDVFDFNTPGIGAFFGVRIEI